MGQKSGGERYNTELACLMAYTGKFPDIKGFDPKAQGFKPEVWFDRTKLQNPEVTYREILKFLPQNYDPKIFNRFYVICQKSKPTVLSYAKGPFKLDWVGGANISDNPADVEFTHFSYHGLSIKGDSGITLANISPTKIGLEEKVGDVVKYYADKTHKGLYDEWKKAVATSALRRAKAMAGRTYSPDPKSPYYNLTYDQKANNYLLGSKGGVSKVFTESEFYAVLGTNPEWQSVLGAHLTANKHEFKTVMTKVFKATAEGMAPAITKALADTAKVETMLNFAKKAYFYQTPKYLYLVPSKYDFTKTPLEVKGVTYDITEDRASGIMLKVNIGLKGSSEFATIDLWIRYANRVFGSNATARVQSLTNPENIAWKKVWTNT